MATTLTIGASPEEPALTSPPPGIDPQPEIASSAFNASPIPDLPEVDPVLNEVVKSNDPIEDKVKMLDLWRDDVLRASKLSDDYSAKKDAIIKLADEDVNVARGALMKNHFEQKAREAFPTIESRDRFMRDFNKYGLNADAYPDGLSTNPMHKEFIQGIKDDSDKLFGNGKASWDLNLATDAGFEILRGKAHETGDGKTLVTGQMRDAPPDGNNAIDGGSPLAALLTGKSADTFLADPKDSKGWNTYNPTFEVDTATPEDIKTETDKVQAELDGIPAKRAELERISRETIEASKSQPFVEGGGMTISPLAVMERQAAELAIKEKSLKTRLANLEKSGKAFLTNERIAAHIRNTPELMSLIPDKGVITRILNGAENMVMDFNVVGEQVGLPWMKGSLAGAAEAKTLKGQIGTGMEQSEFAGDPWSRIKLGVADNAAQTAMQLGLGGSSSAALTYGSMWLSSYGQALTQAEQQIQALRLSGDFEGARKAEENKQLFAIGTAVNDTAWEMAGGPASSMMLGKKALARPFLHAAIDPFVEAGEEIGTSITGAGLGLNNLIGQSSGIQGSDLVVAGFTAMGSAGFQAGISRKLRHLASAPAQMTPEQQAKNEILERVIKEMGVTGNITPPNVKSQRADTENPTTSTMGPDGKITVNLNPMWVHQPEGSQNWTIQDDGIRQRAFQAGLKTDFPTKEEADAFAQTVHQHIFEASVDGQVGDAITQDQVNAQKTLVQSAFQSVINKRPELRMDDLYSRFLIAMEGVQSNPSKGTEQISPEPSPAPETQPPPTNGQEKGQTLLTPQQKSSPAAASAQAIENTLTGEDRIRQSAFGGKLLADRLRTQEQAAAEAPAMTEAWEKRRAHALAMQDQEPAYVSDAQGHPAVTTVLTALDAYDAAQDDDAKLEVLNDIQPATVAAAERIAENTIAKIEADESLNDEEKKAMTEKWWKFAEDIKSVRVASPESSFTKTEAPAPSAPSRESEAGTTNASPPASSQTPAANLPVAQPVGETSVPANTENATARDATKPEQMTPEESYEAYTTAKELAPNLADMPKTKKQIREGIAIAENSGIKDPELQKMFMDSAKAETAQFAGPYIRVQRIRLIEEALEEQKPVSTAAVDTYGITLPEGYVKQGDLYVFQPQTKQAAETQTSGVATERDLTKPKPLTDKELPSLDQRGITESGREIEARFSPTERMEPLSTPDEQRNLREAQSGLAYGKAVRGEPLTQREVDSLPVRLPEGYVKQGDLYVYSKPSEAPAPPTQEAKLQAGREAVNKKRAVMPPVEDGQGGVPYFRKLGEQDASDPSRSRMRSVPQNFKLAYLDGWYAAKKTAPPPKVEGSPPRVGQDVSFMQPGGVVTGKYIGPSSPGSSKVQVGDDVEHVRNGNIAENTPGVTLFQEQEQGNTIRGHIDTPLGNLGHALITLTSRRDGSTLLHEFIHGLGNLEIATGNGKTESLLQVILGDKSNAFHAWAMEGSEKMTDPVEAFRHTHERIAEGFEEWLRTGALPAHKNKGMLRQAFETIRDAMKQIVGDMIGRGVDRRYIPIGTKLPAAALEGYESLFALLDSDNNGKEQNPQPTLGIWDHVKSNSETSEANLYPLTKRGEYGREPLSAAELEYLARNNGLIGPDATNDEAAAVVADLAAQATRNAAAFNQGIALNQSENEVVAADKAKQLIDIATAKLMFMQSVKNDGKVPTLEQWKADLAKTGSHVFDELSDAAMSLIYQGAAMNISSTPANNVRALIQSAMLGANETVTLNEKDEYVRSIAEAAAMVKPGAKRAMQLNAKRASEATSAAQLNAAMNSALKIVGGEARVETRMQSERLRGLMAGYRAGNKSASQLKAILAEMKSMMLPVIKSSDVGASTKSFVNAVINVFDSATKGFDPSSILNTLDQAVVAIDKIGFDKANAAKANFTRGLKIGQRTQAARSEAVAKVLIDELKTVDGITPNEAARVVKMIRDAKTDLQLNRSVWKALLLFQDKRVAQAYDLATTRQEGIKRNLNQGKFGRLSDDVRKFAAFEAWHIPQHMLSQFSTLAGVLASNEAVISLDGVRTQVATQNQQIEAWLEANPPEETVRAPSDAMAKAFDEAMERFNIERDFDEAKNAMDRDKFIASLRELGESEEGAEEAARIQEHWKNFELFKNADKLDLLSLNNREMRGLVNSFRNYNAGIITGFIGRKAAEYRQKQFEEPFVSVLASGLRHIMKLDADKKLDVQGDFDRSVSIVDHTKRLAGWFFGFDRLSRTKIAQSKIGFTGSIEQQIRESGIYNLDSLFETQQWINRNITKQYTDMQADGIFNRMRILNIKDSAGKTIADYHLGFDNVSHYEGDHVTGNPALRKAYQQQFMPGNLNLGAGWNVVAKTPLGIGEKLSNIKNRRNQRMSRWIGFAMMQRQREANGMDGNYVDYVIGEKQHVRTGALDDRAGQIDDAKALMEVMKAAGVVSAPTFKQIAAILPADAHAAIALADRIFDHTGQWTYYLNQLEREAPLPMPVNYFPIQSYEDNASVEASMGSLGFELRGGVVEGQPDNMRAAARHARLNTKLKMANVNFFNVVESSVGKAAADMAATPVLKMVNNSFATFKGVKGKDGQWVKPPQFVGASHNVAEEVRKAMLESGLRLAHPILGDAGVSHTIRGLVSQLLAQKSLAQAMRPLREVVGNMATNVLAGKFPATYRGWTARNVPGGNQFWDKLMVDLKAPTAMRSGPEAVNGIMQDMTLGIEDMLNHEHIPGFFAEIGKEIRHKRPQERSLIGRLQSHLLARVSRAAIKGLVTAGENPIIWPQWTGHFMDSIKDQTGAEFDRAKYEAGGYTADQLSIAVTTSEKGISDFMAQSARGGGRLAAMVPLNIDQRNAFLNSMMYQLTSFIGAQSNASRFAYKALARSPVGSQASNKAIATIGGLLVGNMVVNSAGTILAQAMKAGLDLGKIDFGGDDEEEKARRRAKSLAIHEFEETRDNALFLNGAREGANFWAVMGLRSMFSLRFGGASAIARLGAATALETAWMMAGDVQDYLTERGVPAGGWKERGGYNPYRDNVTFESTAWAAAFAYKRIAPFVPFISMDEKVDRAWQSSNALSVATTFGPTNALLSTLADMSRDVGNVMDGSLGRAGSAADFLLNSLMIANAFPIYPTVRPFTNEAAKNETIGNESFKETIFDKRAEQAGRAYAENPTKENEKRLAALPPDSMPIANRWIEKTMILNNASTVPGEPAKSRMLAHSLHSIESYKEKERHIELTNQYYKMKKAGVRGEFVNAIQQLRDSGKWGDTFGSKGDSSDFAQEMLKYDRETQRGEVPLEAYGSFY